MKQRRKGGKAEMKEGRKEVKMTFEEGALSAPFDFALPSNLICAL